MPTYSFGERAIQGREENGVTTAEVGVTENDLHVAIHSPLSGFGETLVVEPTPRVQIDAVYGVIDSDHETFSAGSGSITVADSMFVADCGTGVGSYGTIRSLRAGLHRSGQSLLCRISAEFEAGVANYLSGAGLFNAVDGLWVGYNDTEFGFTRR
ncbi:MAG: hypothetical protein KDB07_10620, partial [Planctomycetes bacterium]|nr:hypothetical protein [Planctomycetota bacterium]